MSNPSNPAVVLDELTSNNEPSIEVLESSVPGSRLHSILDNPTDIVIAEG